MAERHELYAYRVFGRVKYSRSNEIRRFGELNGPEAEKSDILDHLDEILKEGAERPKHPDPDETVCRVESYESDDSLPRERWGRIRVTRPAVSKEVVERQSGDEVKVRRAEHLEGRPLFFWMELPKESSEGLLLVERTSGWGIVSTFWDGVLREVEEEHEKVSLKREYYVPKPIWDVYREIGSGLDGGTFKRVIPNPDESTSEGEATHEAEEGMVKTDIDFFHQPDREETASFLERASRVNQRLHEIVRDIRKEMNKKEPDTADLVAARVQAEHELHATIREAFTYAAPTIADEFDPESYEEASLRLRVGAKHRTFHIGRTRVPPIGYPVEGPSYHDGYPTVASMLKAARDLRDDIGGALGL